MESGINRITGPPGQAHQGTQFRRTDFHFPLEEVGLESYANVTSCGDSFESYLQVVRLGRVPFLFYPWWFLDDWIHLI
jgi:hypothetical protein